jgi:phosphotransferase system enzyme I (PtsI)
MKKLKGIPIYSGIAIGKAFLYLEQDLPNIPRYGIRKNQIEAELKRLVKAFSEAADELKALHERAVAEMSRELAGIFSAHLLMLEDADFIDTICERLKETQENIEWVIYDTSRSLMQKMLSSPEQAFRERAVDINDVSRRVLNRLLSVKKFSLSELDHDVILVVHDLLPSEVLTMNRNHVKGIAMDMGGSTSHTAILARAFNIPAVLGLSQATAEISTDDTLVLNAAAGEVFVNPEKKYLDRWKRVEARHNKKSGAFSRLRDLPAETKDGYRVSLKANIEIHDEAKKALNFGAEGIGLYRSEFLFLNPGESAEEELQFSAYSKIVNIMGGLPVTIRTVDLGGDKVLPNFTGAPAVQRAASEKNPLL